MNSFSEGTGPGAFTRPKHRAGWFILLFSLLNCGVRQTFAQAPDPGGGGIRTGDDSDFALPAPQLSISRESPLFQLSWPSAVAGPDGAMARPWFELQYSLDLHGWQPVGQRMRASTAAEGQVLCIPGVSDEPMGFFRLLQVAPSSAASALGQGGAEVLGYGAAFETELKRIGHISPEQFEAMFPNTAEYLQAPSWDPTTARFWEEFNTAPLSSDGRQDFRLDPNELALFKKNAFVVSERMSSPSFAGVFSSLRAADLPVFISCDALLQAWHRTYDGLLEEVEETYLFRSAEEILDGMAAQLGNAAFEIGDGVLRDSLLDADYFLTVARALLAGTDAPPIASPLGQDRRVAETLADIRAEELKLVPDFMGFCRMVDFSQFKVRGHYTHSERLGRYFQCLMWLGRIDIPIAGGPWMRCPGDVRFASPRELGVAIVLWHLLNASGEFETWADMERTISVFVGPTDSLNFGQLSGLLVGAGIQSLREVTNLAVLERVQSEIVEGELGLQNIRSDWFAQPLGDCARYALPRSFTVFGQKFVPDSWVFSQVVYSSIEWAENGCTTFVPRRVPGALDVAFAVLANDQVVPELVAQMQGTFHDPDRPHALAFRDGLRYQHNLAAVRAVMDQQTPEAWEQNIYMQWLWCLRALSAPTTGALYPEAMRTRAWAMKTLNTQLASWTHLRHDTILYAKQSYTGIDGCFYPTGFIEPRLEFWKRLTQTATAAAEQISGLHYEGVYEYTDPDTGLPAMATLATIQHRQMDHLRNFAVRIQQLETLAAKELDGEPFSDRDLQFLDDLLDRHDPGWVYNGYLTYSGWYPELFYRAIHWSDFNFHTRYGAGGTDALVADVHTDLPCVDYGDPGSVLHQAVGRVHYLMIAVDLGDNRFVCAGPVLSHYEFEIIGSPRRLSDPEWDRILQGEFPSDLPPSRVQGLNPPVWTEAYLAR
jgi:hypothetical protein